MSLIDQVKFRPGRGLAGGAQVRRGRHFMTLPFENHLQIAQRIGIVLDQKNLQTWRMLPDQVGARCQVGVRRRRRQGGQVEPEG